MAYQSTTVNTPTDFVNAVNAFAVTNGWTLTTDVLSKGTSHVRFTTELTLPNGRVRVSGARNGVFSGIDLAASLLNINPWPTNLQLELFHSPNPDTFWFVLHWLPGYYLHMGFGELEKYGVWNGGTWIHGQHAGTAQAGAASYSLIEGNGAPYYSGNPAECGLFWQPNNRDSWNGSFVDTAASKLLCELRGFVWEGATSNADGGRIFSPKLLSPIHKNNPNTFNGQTILTPHQLYLLNTDGHHMAIGHVEHARFVLMTNYNPEDILTIGAERWKVYPRLRKEVAYPDGSNTGYSGGALSTGLLGIAIRYDGP